MQLRNCVVLVTGAVGDIGGEISMAMARAGARLVLNDVVPEGESQRLLGPIADLGAEAIYCRADVADRQAVEHMMTRAADRFGPCDVCVGNAAIVEVNRFLDLPEESWARQLNTNLTGCFQVSQAAARQMVQAGKPGKIIFISSAVQDIPTENLAAYCVAKSGLKMLAKCMALELGRHRITVNLVAPGFVDAGLSGRLFREKPGLREEATKYVPLGHMLSAADVAAGVMMLCSAGADDMTGSTLLIDGGFSLFYRGANP